MAFATPFPLINQAAATEPMAYQQDLNVRLICPDCKNPVPNIVEEFSSGDLVCGDCGLILGDRIIDTRSEWRTFANDEGDDPSRVGAAANPLLSGNQLDTIISYRDGNTGISRDLSKTQSKSAHVRGERNLLAAYKEIGAMCSAIHLPKTVTDVACQLFKRVDDEKLLRGKSNDAVMAACIFIACRQDKVPRTFKEICALTKVSKKEIGRCFKALEKVFETDRDPTSTSAEKLMVRFCNHLGLGPNVQREAEDLARSAKKLGTLAGRSPISVAAACIYMISALFKTPKSAKDIAIVAGVSDVTIRNAYKYLYAEREKLIDAKVLAQPGVKMEYLPPN